MTDIQPDDIGMHTEEPHEWTIDLVCGMEFDPNSTSYHVDFNGKTYSFCSKGCHEHFKAAPSQYAL